MLPHNNMIGVTMIADNSPLNKKTTPSTISSENIHIARLIPNSMLNGIITTPRTIRLNMIPAI